VVPPDEVPPAEVQHEGGDGDTDAMNDVGSSEEEVKSEVKADAASSEAEMMMAEGE